MAAETSFQKQKGYFSDPQKHPFPLQGDMLRMPNRSDQNKKAIPAVTKHEKGSTSHEGRLGKHMENEQVEQSKPHRGDHNTPSFYRQSDALKRQAASPPDEDDTKILRYSISFTENCNLIEDDVEIYEYLSPTNSITRCSLLYGTVPSPLSHVLIDYRNIRTALIRQAYADSYNTQVKFSELHLSRAAYGPLVKITYFVPLTDIWVPISNSRNRPR